ncbi:hypothetical protein O1L44_11840 [Streptomyces noursei]|uniref:hypothetical protein n=1 Tax=Streptomyces noursei TaxID=1971 RepID=UPI0013521007|nr:hypothetical protein [Streptomyces noursei]
MIGRDLMATPAWGQPPQSASQASGMSPRKKGCLGCGGAAVGAFVLLVIIGLIVGPQKQTPSAAKAAPTISSAASSAPPASPTTTKRSTAAPSHKPSPTPHQNSGDVNRLEHGAQQGLGNCIIMYKDAQMGRGTSTFSALVLDDSGKAYAPADSDPYSVVYEMTVTGTDGTHYAVNEFLGSGSRTAADNGGSDWFTVNQGQVQVSANATEGMVDSTVPVSLARVKSARGDIVVTKQNDDNYLKQDDCAVRPAQG